VRSYYGGSAIPNADCCGSVFFGQQLDKLRPSYLRLVYVIQWTTIFWEELFLGCCATSLHQLALMSGRLQASFMIKFREEIGWQDLAQNVAKVYNSLPIEERQQTAILTGNYGEGGALNLYGPALGLPHTMCLTNSFWYRGYDLRQQPQTTSRLFDFNEAKLLLVL